jgi:NAD(P)-dependent dehydrogenase (short-subunit alcohol dehydrogenase family)
MELIARAASGPPPTMLTLDLTDLRSVRRCAAVVDEQVEQLDLLMNNAGVMGLTARNTLGPEIHFATNHLGHFALTGLLLPSLLRATSPRVVTVSSLGYVFGRLRWEELEKDARRHWPASYCQSKLANMLFSFELDRRARLTRRPLVSVAAHPGWTKTNLTAHNDSPTPFLRAITAMEGLGLAQPSWKGALPQLYAATMPDVSGGDFFGPDGLFKLRGGPRRDRARNAASEGRDAGRLWELSQKLTGVIYEWS